MKQQKIKINEGQMIYCMTEFGRYLRNRIFFDNQEGENRYFRNQEIEMMARYYFDTLKREDDIPMNLSHLL